MNFADESPAFENRVSIIGLLSRTNKEKNNSH